MFFNKLENRSSRRYGPASAPSPTRSSSRRMRGVHNRPSPYEKTITRPYGSKRSHSPHYILGISTCLSTYSPGSVQRSRPVEDSFNTNANQPRPRLPNAQRQSANRLWIWKPSVRHYLSRRCVGPSNRHSHNSAGALRYVLQRDGCATGRSPFRHKRNATIRSLSW